jgi:dipeptidase E
MKKLFLTSKTSKVAGDIARNLPKGLKLAFINTPAEPYGEPQPWLLDDRKALEDSGFIVSEIYTFTGKKAEEIKKFLSDYDGIFICGGNTFYCLEKVQQSGCAEVIREFVASGKIYIGSSAGSIIAGPDIYPTFMLDKVEKAPELKGYEGFGLTDVVVFPHWGTDKFKERYLNFRMQHAYTEKHKIILLTDNQYLKVEDDKYQIIDVTNK